MKLQSKNYEILKKQKLRKKIYIYLPLTCFLFRNSLTTIYSRTIISSSSGMSCKSSVSKIAANPLSTRAYFKGRAYIKIILKNHARSYFAGRSYYRGNTVGIKQPFFSKNLQKIAQQLFASPPDSHSFRRLVAPPPGPVCDTFELY